MAKVKIYTDEVKGGNVRGDVRGGTRGDRVEFEDNEHVRSRVAFAIGVAGGVLLTILGFLARAVGLTPLNVEMVWGSLFTAQTSMGSWWLGLFIHLIVSGLIGMAYGAGFRVNHHSGAGVGTAFGVIHWIVGGIFMGILPVLHPLLPERVNNPGLFVMGYGATAALTFFVLHLLYGATVGSLFRVAALAEGQHTRMRAATTA